MKKCILILSLLFIANCVFADETLKSLIGSENRNCGCANQAKCLDLMNSMYHQRATLYNVLNLSSDQQKCKDVIDKMRYEELGKLFEQYEQEKYVLANMCKHNASENALKKQEKVVKNIEKSMKKTGQRYDKEFKKILDFEQKTKLNSIRKMQRKEIKYCQKNKAFYERDEKLRPFGTTTTEERLCPIHKKWHPFGFRHKE